jgi:glutathione S-transferase
MGLPYAVQNHSFPLAPNYRALDPLGTVPFVEDAGGVALTESVAIVLYIAQRLTCFPTTPSETASTVLYFKSL